MSFRVDCDSVQSPEARTMGSEAPSPHDGSSGRSLTNSYEFARPRQLHQAQEKSYGYHQQPSRSPLVHSDPRYRLRDDLNAPSQSPSSSLSRATTSTAHSYRFPTQTSRHPLNSFMLGGNVASFASSHVLDATSFSGREPADTALSESYSHRRGSEASGGSVEQAGGILMDMGEDEGTSDSRQDSRGGGGETEWSPFASVYGDSRADTGSGGRQQVYYAQEDQAGYYEGNDDGGSDAYSSPRDTSDFKSQSPYSDFFATYQPTTTPVSIAHSRHTPSHSFDGRPSSYSHFERPSTPTYSLSAPGTLLTTSFSSLAAHSTPHTYTPPYIQPHQPRPMQQHRVPSYSYQHTPSQATSTSLAPSPFAPMLDRATTSPSTFNSTHPGVPEVYPPSGSSSRRPNDLALSISTSPPAPRNSRSSSAAPYLSLTPISPTMPPKKRRNSRAQVISETGERPISPITGKPTKIISKRQWPPKDAAKRIYSCPFEDCDKTFGRPSARETHIRSHSGVRPYICPITSCQRAFSVFSNLKRHMIVHPTVDFRQVAVNDLAHIRCIETDEGPVLQWIDEGGANDRDGDEQMQSEVKDEEMD